MTTSAGVPGAEDQGVDDDTGVYGTDTNDLLHDGCLIEGDPGSFGYVHECTGAMSFSFKHDTDFNVGEGAAIFGGGDNPPTVMACCDIYDPPPPPQPHEQACYKDMVETFCEESVAGLAGAAFTESGLFEPGAVAELVTWISQHSADCNVAFHTVLDAQDPLAPDGIQDISWQINETFEGSVLDLNPIIDPIITITESGIGSVSELMVGDNYIECVDNDFNDGQFFPAAEAAPEFMLFLDEGDGILTGPVYDEDPVLGELLFASNDTFCSAPLCSQIQFSENVSDWTLHSLSLYSSNVTRVGDQVNDAMVDWFHIALAGPVQGEVRGTDFFQVPAGAAIFSLGGVIEGEAHHLVVSNASSISVQKVGDDWETSSFALYYVDSEEDNWSLFIAGAEWVSP